MLILIFITTFAIVYSEIGWSLIKNGQKSFEEMSRAMKIVSGINYGENVASGITISGTVGAALEAASFEVHNCIH